mgnify:CR=1 FL=1
MRAAKSIRKFAAKRAYIAKIWRRRAMARRRAKIMPCGNDSQYIAARSAILPPERQKAQFKAVVI